MLCKEDRNNPRRPPVRIVRLSHPCPRAPLPPLRSSHHECGRLFPRCAHCGCDVPLYVVWSQSLRALNGCEKTLNAVWKRAARKRPGSSPTAAAAAAPTDSSRSAPPRPHPAMQGAPMQRCCCPARGSPPPHAAFPGIARRRAVTRLLPRLDALYSMSVRHADSAALLHCCCLRPECAQRRPPTGACRSGVSCASTPPGAPRCCRSPRVPCHAVLRPPFSTAGRGPPVYIICRRSLGVHPQPG
jgi:hypothetical protein